MNPRPRLLLLRLVLSVPLLWWASSSLSGSRGRSALAVEPLLARLALVVELGLALARELVEPLVLVLLLVVLVLVRLRFVPVRTENEVRLLLPSLVSYARLEAAQRSRQAALRSLCQVSLDR